MALVEAAYRITPEFPISVPANIAEGNARSSRKDYARFVSIARGSLAETETLLMLARRIGLARPERLDSLLNEADRVGRMLNGLPRSLEKDD